MNIDDYRWIATVIISLVALIFTILNYRKIGKMDENSMVRLIAVSETLDNDFRSLHAIHSGTHLFNEKNEEFSDELNASFNRIESRIELLYDLLIQNKKISKKDLKNIINELREIESNLIELKFYKIESFEDSENVKAFINPIYRSIEIIKSSISEYDKDK